MTTGKTIALTRRTYVGKVMSLLLNMLSRLVITFFPRSKRLLISWLQSSSAVILEPPQNKFWHCFHCFPIYFPSSDGTRCHDLSFQNVVLNPKSGIKKWEKINNKEQMRETETNGKIIDWHLIIFLIISKVSSLNTSIIRKKYPYWIYTNKTPLYVKGNWV